jgi:hypothetical protein
MNHDQTQALAKILAHLQDEIEHCAEMDANGEDTTHHIAHSVRELQAMVDRELTLSLVVNHELGRFSVEDLEWYARNSMMDEYRRLSDTDLNAKLEELTND